MSIDWRVANALVHLRSQINEACPVRDKSSDGSIGDENHASRSSDHNPWVVDSEGRHVVTAIDITHDPKNGFDSYKFADWLREIRDPRIKYVISNGRIFAWDVSAWTWRKYSGTNKHDHHVHISARPTQTLYDDIHDWELEGFGFQKVKNAPAVPAVQVLAKGVKGGAVEELQKLLKIEPVDGIFGQRTDDAVRLFQKANGLEPDGVVGLYTWQKLRKGK